MKKLTVIIIALISFLAIPGSGDASYRILLKNGGEFKTDRYWKEGSQIRFDIYGGVAGVQKASVRRIERISPHQMPRSEAVTQKKPVLIGTDRNATEKPDEGSIDIGVYREKKTQLDAELSKALDTLRESTKKGDATGREAARATVDKISEEIYALTDEAMTKSGGNLPKDWWDKQ